MKNYYEENAEKYIEDTKDCDMSEQYRFFLKHMPAAGKILDIGFGSGRDMMHFKSLGYSVFGIDSTLSFVNRMRQQSFNVIHKSAEDLDFINEFEGIWACASLLHVKRENLHFVLKKCSNALQDNGIMYCSFKYGDFEGVKNGRYFNYMDENQLLHVIQNTNLNIIETCITYDVRQNRPNEKWINIIMKNHNF